MEYFFWAIIVGLGLTGLLISKIGNEIAEELKAIHKDLNRTRFAGMCCNFGGGGW